MLDTVTMNIELIEDYRRYWKVRYEGAEYMVPKREGVISHIRFNDYTLTIPVSLARELKMPFHPVRSTRRS